MRDAVRVVVRRIVFVVLAPLSPLPPQRSWEGRRRDGAVEVFLDGQSWRRKKRREKEERTKNRQKSETGGEKGKTSRKEGRGNEKDNRKKRVSDKARNTNVFVSCVHVLGATC